MFRLIFPSYCWISWKTLLAFCCLCVGVAMAPRDKIWAVVWNQDKMLVHIQWESGWKDRTDAVKVVFRSH